MGPRNRHRDQERARGDDQEAYWKTHLSGHPPPQELPFANPRPPVQSFIRGQEAIDLRAGLLVRIKKFCLKENVTVFETLLATLDILLMRYTGQTDIVVGSLSVNCVPDRDRQTEFVNAIPLRTDLVGNPTTRAALRRVVATVKSARANREYPFSKLLKIVTENASIGRSPVFQVMLIPRDMPDCISDIAISREHLSDIAEYATSCDLVIIVDNIERTLRVSCEYDADLFDSASVNQMLWHFHTLLESIIADPDHAISTLPLLTDAERHRLLVEWNKTEQAYRYECVHQRLEHQAARTPDAVAVVCQHQQLTYGELNRKANQLARYLRSLGVGPEACVGIILPRSLELVIGLIGILKAGGAYVPLDPDHPRKRLAALLSDAHVSVLLTQTSVDLSQLKCEARVVRLDTDWESICAERSESIHLSAIPENLAYVMYTSGSTGTPKGVMITHRGLANYLSWCASTYAVAEGEGAPVNGSIAFDATVTSLWSPLVTGRKLLLLPEHGEIEALSAALYSANHFSLIKITPAVLDLLNQFLPAEAIHGHPRLLVIGGEALSRKSLAFWRAHAAQTRLINEYGPTETVVGCCVYEIPGDAELPESIPIGRPIANTQLHILDRCLQPVPVGIPAELNVGGAGLARGYLNAPDITAEKFIPNPFSDQPGTRLYKTGDLARFRPDANIEFLGRLDDQVKIRGFRVEPGEVEAALRRHPRVSDAIVLAQEGASPLSSTWVQSRAEKRLVAYVLPKTGHAVAPTDLRDFLDDLLPTYLHPAAFLLVDEFPLTPNGKVDRAALRRPDQSSVAAERAFVPPRSLEERILAAIWAKALGLRRVGIYDNFFELGGDSILAIQMITQASRAGLQFTRKQLFEQKCIARLAAVTTTTVPGQAEQGPVTGSVPLTPIQHWLFELDLPNPDDFGQSIRLNVAPDVKPVLLANAVRYLVDHHDALRLRFRRAESGWQPVNLAPGAAVPFSVVDLSALDLDEHDAVLGTAVDSVKATLNLSNGPIMQVTLFKRGVEKPALLVWVIHHLAVDAVSWRILLEDLHRAYEQLDRGDGVHLPRKTTAFKSWSERLCAYAQSDDFTTELEYWLADAQRPVARLSRDYATKSESNTVASAADVTLSLEQKETSDLLHVLPRTYNTNINDVLVAALAMTWAFAPHQGDLLIDLEGHGREELFADMDLSRTVGWFTTVFPVRVAPADHSNPDEVLKAVKSQLDRLPNKGLGYGLARYLAGDVSRAALRALPQAELSLNYLGQFDQILSDAPLFDWFEPAILLTESPRGLRRYLFEITAFVTSGKLHVKWTYSRNIHERSSVERLASRFIKALADLTVRCKSRDHLRPSDLPAARLSEDELEQFTTAIKQAKAQNLIDRIEDVYELTPLQHGLLFHTLRSPDSGVYFEQLVCRVRGQLNVEAFKHAWELVIQRHAVLRTAFFWQGLHKPLQVVVDGVGMPWTVHDWQGQSAAEQHEQVETALQRERRHGFALDDAPLMRCTLAQTGRDTHQFVWNYHHLLLDRWSVSLVLNDLLAFYRACNSGQHLSLGPPQPYRDYLSWLQRQDLRQAEVFWRRDLQGFTAPSFIGDRVTGNAAEGREAYEEQQRQLSPETTAALRAVAQQHQLTLNTLILGAWALLLSRYGGHDDVVFGATISGRPADLAGMESMVGLFINTLPVRVSVPSEAPLLRWLQALQMRQLERERYAHSALVDIQEWSRAPRGVSLFESIVVFENYPLDVSLQAKRSNLEIDQLRIVERTNYALTLIVMPSSVLTLSIGYEIHRFDSATIGRMLSHLCTLLEGFVTNGHRCLRDVSLVTDAERQQLLVDWNDTGHVSSQDRCLHHLVESQVRQTPDAVAISCGTAQLTYQELNRRANQLAHYLKRLGVGPDVPVGVAVDRSPDMLIAILSVLKASGAYLPLDPAYPKSRLAFILADGRVPVLVTQRHLLPQLSGNDAEVVCLDRDWQLIAREREQDPISAIDATNLAYVLYTSGSTGSPKGVAIEHRSAVVLLDWALATFTPKELSRVAASTSLCFDLSVFELFVPLCCGSTVALFENVLDLSRLSTAQGITLVNTVPSAMAELLRVGGMPPSVRTVVLAGEPLHAKLVEEIYATGHVQQVFNLYGPSEDGTYSTSVQLAQASGEPSIGRPIANKQVYLLDAQLEPVPIGVSGELHLGGDGLARGYFNRADLTAERFIPNPFRQPGGRLYRTGDLACYRPDGSIDLLGRIDHQVKVRGFRIELGEIEAVLSQHPAVCETVVVAHSEESHDLGSRAGSVGKRLVAYVVAGREQSSLTQELRNHLQQKLPTYMVPTSFVFLDSMPRLPNGKVDRRALRPSDQTWEGLDRRYAAPRTPVERGLVQIWSEVLGIARIGIDDNFFVLGGHSLKVATVISRVRLAYKVEIPLHSIFQMPTIAGLAQVIEHATQNGTDHQLPPIVALPRSEHQHEASRYDQAMGARDVK
jgi:amino acid adenylation domain-containing protein/non-ribosomal peptide synthase protein (TIGR01720 family)